MNLILVLFFLPLSVFCTISGKVTLTLYDIRFANELTREIFDFEVVDMPDETTPAQLSDHLVRFVGIERANFNMYQEPYEPTPYVKGAVPQDPRSLNNFLESSGDISFRIVASCATIADRDTIPGLTRADDEKKTFGLSLEYCYPRIIPIRIIGKEATQTCNVHFYLPCSKAFFSHSLHSTAESCAKDLGFNQPCSFININYINKNNETVDLLPLMQGEGDFNMDDILSIYTSFRINIYLK